MKHRGFSSVIRLVRGSNWWYSKIPPLLAVAYATLLWQTPPPGMAIAAILGLLLCLCALAAYGHVVNDVFDVVEDRSAGKPNLMTQRSTSQRIALCVLLAAIGFVPWLVCGFGLAAAMVLVANYLLPTVYSAPPLRLKERGVWGVIADAAGVHAVPTLFVVTAIANLASVPVGASLPLALVATTWALLAGLRGILIHQLWDRESDVQAGATTFVTGRDPDRVRRLTTWIIFPAEILAFAGLAWVVFPIAPWVLYLGLGYALFDLLKLRFVWKRPFDPAPRSPGIYIPPSDLYEVWLPLLLAALLAARDPLFLLLTGLHLALFFADIRMRTREVLVALSELPAMAFRKVHG
jgi:hypothetical protein